MSGFSGPERESFRKRHPSSNDTVPGIISVAGCLLHEVSPKNMDAIKPRDALKISTITRNFCFFILVSSG